MPVADNQGRKIPVSYHRRWDSAVRAIAGGLTIFEPAKGEWLHLDSKLFSEKMIPVRISCADAAIAQIADLTARHYKQKAVMYYRVSDQVIIKHY